MAIVVSNSMGTLLGLLVRAFLFCRPKASKLVELRLIEKGKVVSRSSGVIMRGIALYNPMVSESV